MEWNGTKGGMIYYKVILPHTQYALLSSPLLSPPPPFISPQASVPFTSNYNE
jgi:hypothetical protein